MYFLQLQYNLINFFIVFVNNYRSEPYFIINFDVLIKTEKVHLILPISLFIFAQFLVSVSFRLKNLNFHKKSITFFYFIKLN